MLFSARTSGGTRNQTDERDPQLDDRQTLFDLFLHLQGGGCSRSPIANKSLEARNSDRGQSDLIGRKDRVDQHHQQNDKKFHKLRGASSVSKGELAAPLQNRDQNERIPGRGNDSRDIVVNNPENYKPDTADTQVGRQ